MRRTGTSPMTLRHQSGLLGAALAFALSSAAARAQDIVKQDLTEIEVVGSTALDDGQIVPVPTDVNEKRKDLSALTQLPQSDAADMVAAPLTTPFAATTPFARREGARGFDGLNHFDQRNAGTGPYANSQFSLEPPDQALCVGNGFVVEAVNTALAVYSEGGRRLKGPTALNQFFGAKPEINRTTGVRGDFLSDPLHRLRGHDRTLGRLFGRRGRARRQPVDGDRGVVGGVDRVDGPGVGRVP